MLPDGPEAASSQPAPSVEPRIVIDGAGLIIAVDEAATALLDATAVTFLGRPLELLVVTEERAAIRTLLAARAASGDAGPARRIELALLVGGAPTDGEPAAGDDDLASADATVLPVEACLTPGPGPGETTVLMHDISARRVAERVARATDAVTGAIARAESPAKAAGLLLAALGTTMGWNLGVYWSVGADGQLERTATWSADDRNATRLFEGRVVPEGSLAGRALTERATVWARDLQAETEVRACASAAAAGYHGAVAVPMERDGAVVAVLVLFDTRPRQPDPATRRALSEAGRRIGDLLGVLEERYTLVTRLARLALTDELTGLPNRRAWEDALARELARAARGGHTICVAVLDLDHFKTFNDRHGHLAGDRLLADTARAWQRQLRMSDLLARYGGEEFAAVIPAWPLATAVDVVERLRRATPDGITASAGVAAWNGSETGQELFGRADAALYEAKQAGRNRTLAHRPSP